MRADRQTTNRPTNKLVRKRRQFDHDAIRCFNYLSADVELFNNFNQRCDCSEFGCSLAQIIVNVTMGFVVGWLINNWRHKQLTGKHERRRLEEDSS